MTDRETRMKQRHLCALKALGAENPRAVAEAIDVIERRHQRKALAYCNEEQPEGWFELWQTQQQMDLAAIREVLPRIQDGALFINQDPRGYSVKIDNDSKAGKEAILLSGCVIDLGGYGLLQSEAYQ